MITSRRVLIVIGIVTLGTIMFVVGDPTGLRQADLVRFNVNDSTTSFLRVLVNSGCDENEHNDLEKSVFVIVGNLRDNDVEIKWTAPDALNIRYVSGLKIIQQLKRVEFDDSKLNIRVNYQEMAPPSK